MGVNWTQEQRKVINLRNRNILVSAAAGSGKTAVLVERILKIITDEEHPVDIDRLLVMTFTRAAAGEMRVRLEQALSQRLEEDPENEHLQRQSTLLHNAQITTIDGFCSYLIRNYFHMLDLDPGYRTADEGELRLMRVDVVRDVLEEFYSQKDPDYENFVEWYAPGKTDEGLENLILKLYDFAMSNPWPKEWLRQCAAVYEAESWEEVETSDWMRLVWEHSGKILGDQKEQILESLELCRHLDGPYMYEPMLQEDLSLVEKLLSVREFDEMVRLLEKPSYARLSSKKDSSVSQMLKEQVQEKRKEFKEALGKLGEQYFFTDSQRILRDLKICRKPIQIFIQVTLRFLECFAEKKREKNLVDFSDMEHFALDILVKKEGEVCTPTQAARELSERYEEILIDEYQDSNYVQELLLTYVSGWAKNKKNIFIVGDVKQSIYRFRLAVPDLFMEKFHRYSLQEGEEQRIDLHKNFRSRSQVLEGVNFLFRQIMGAELGKVEYDEEAALYPGAVFPEGKEEGLETEVLLIPRQTVDWMEEKEAKTQREVEALAIAQRIHQMVGKEMVLDKESGEYRPVRYGDIVVLLRTVSGWAEEFLQIFGMAGIPAYTASKTGYFSALEVVTVLNYLHICDNPLQEIPFTAVLHSPIVGCSAQELATMKNSFPDLPVYLRCVRYAQEGEDEKLREKLKTFLELFDRSREKVPYTPIHQFIQEILDETGYGAYAAALPGGRQRQANLNMLVEKAMDYEQTSYRGLFNFIRYIEKIQKYDVDFGEVNLAGNGEDTVQILSIHKSKGLEFPVVFVAGMGKRFNIQDLNASVMIHPDLGLGTDVTDVSQRLHFPTLPKQVMRGQLRDENLGEELRVLYVALTRAKEKLILTGLIDRLDKKLSDYAALLGRRKEKLSYSMLSRAACYWDWILPALARHSSMENLYDQFEIYHGQAPYGQEDARFVLRLVPVDDLMVQQIQQNVQREVQREKLEAKMWEYPGEEEIYQTLTERFSYQYPFDIQQQIPAKITVSELKRQGQSADFESEPMYFEPDVIPLVPEFIQKKEEDLTGASRGTAYHRVVECLDYARIDSVEQIEEQMDEWVRDKKLSQAERASVRGTDIYALVCSDLGRRMAEAAAQGRLHREQPFVILQSADCINPHWNSEDMVLIQGIMDAWFQEGDQLVLVDYKTDFVLAGEERTLIERYQIQLDSYAEALERMTGRKVGRKVIYSFCLGKEILV